MDPYKVLEVERNATPNEIKASYRRLSREWHPDKGGSTDIMAEINTAYEILKDPNRRAEYDRTGQTVEVPLDNIARGRIINMFLEAGKKNHWKRGDYIAAMRRAVSDGERQIQSKVNSLQEAHDLMDEMVPTSVDEDGNMFVGAIRQQQDGIQRELANCQKELDIAEHIMTLLEPYEDNLPPQQFTQQFFFSTSSGTTSSTGGL